MGQNGVMDHEADLQWFRSFVVNSRWRFAKTYVESYPHEYTLERWGSIDSFRRAILCIERCGVEESFWNAERKYLFVDERKYWHMGDVSSEKADQRPSLINRTWVDVGAYREEARLLGYDGQDLERLISRWRFLLEKATGRA